MEKNLNMALVSSHPKFLLDFSQNSSLKTSARELTRPRIFSFGTPFSFPNSSIAPRASRISVSAHFNGASRRIPHNVLRKSGADRFASVSSSSSNQQTSSVGVNPNLSPPPPPPSQIGSPLFWIAVGVGASVLYSWVASSLQKNAMQQAFKNTMGPMNTQNNQFSNVSFPSGSPFLYPMPPATGPAKSPPPAPPQPAVTVDVPATKVEAAPETDTQIEVKQEKEIREPKKPAFIDVSPEETMEKSPFENLEDVTETSSPKDVSDGGAAAKQDLGASGGFQSTSKPGSVLPVEALEKMMEDPTVQKMVYPYLPEEMRNPETFKWMLQNPQYRQQLQDMINSMGGSAALDNRMMESFKNFDEVKQQFNQIGITPEEVISKIMANPDIAMAFQNPRVQQAIMDVSQNPLNITKYQNDKEVMDVFNKMSELFPGAGSL
ncbi:hypothetical protein SLE2022_148760 [Rubroshorea leprosula]